jgi:hypothetical protein
MNPDNNETEPDRRALAISVWENKEGREHLTRRMVNSAAASKWIAPGRSITCPPASLLVSTARH